MSENGGIGRHARLRTLWLNGCGGSTPPSRTFLLFIFLFSLQGCHEAPDVVLTSALSEYESGNYETFSNYLTPDSNTWFQGLRSLPSTLPVFLSTRDVSKFEIISVQVVENGLQERGEYDKAVFRHLAVIELDVDGKRVPFTLSQFPDGWKLDLFSLGDVWQSAASRALPRL